ncbi:MAG: hypothetical protein M3Y37_11065 [Chloroflexota bacterium]|nr:hypothetical protein [Chloroflexota bacterium]
MAQKKSILPDIDEAASEQIHAGCPMLIRAAAAHPLLEDRPFMRCALGWSIYSMLAQARCAATRAVQDCWQEHPERTPLLDEAESPLALQVLTGKAAAD